MDWLVAPMTVQLLGAVLVIGALLHLATVLLRARSDAAMARRYHDQRLQQLDLELATAAVRHRSAVRAVDAGWSGTRKFRIERKVPESDSVTSFYLIPHDGKALPPFKPGQFLTFQLKLPDRAKPLVRCYSLSDSPSETGHYRISVKRLDPPPKAPDAPPGLSSNFLHREVSEGEILDVKAPAGDFFLDLEERRPVVLIGGGVGITPVFSMLKAACAAGYDQEIWFFSGARFGADQIYQDDLKALEAAHDNLRVCLCYSEPTEGDVLGETYHHHGWVGVDLFKQMLPSNNYVFYICGPPPMMAAVTQDLADRGVPKADIRMEAFGPASIKKTESKPASDVPAVTVEFAHSGKTVNWSGAETLLELAEDNDVVIDSGCRAGNCGTCVTAVRSGEVDYASPPSAEPEAGSCLPCIARPTSNLVLDA